jgi:hypothetical protein
MMSTVPSRINEKREATRFEFASLQSFGIFDDKPVFHSFQLSLVHALSSSSPLAL